MPTMPTSDEILALVNTRTPDLTDAKKAELVTSTLAILAEPKNARLLDEPMKAVKLAVARLTR